MNFKKWVKSIQTAGYNGARTVDYVGFDAFRYVNGILEQRKLIQFDKLNKLHT